MSRLPDPFSVRVGDEYLSSNLSEDEFQELSKKLRIRGLSLYKKEGRFVVDYSDPKLRLGIID